jgi:formylglycine-generating enzyme required for sulfatase activity
MNMSHFFAFTASALFAALLLCANALTAQTDLTLISAEQRRELAQAKREMLPSAELAFARVRFTSDTDGILWLPYTAQPVEGGKPLLLSVPAQFSWRFVDRDTFFISPIQEEALDPDKAGQEVLVNIRVAQAYQHLARRYATEMGLHRLYNELDKEMVPVPPRQDSAELPGFAIGKYEVTVAQYRFFQEVAGQPLDEFSTPESAVVVTSLRAAPEIQKGIDYQYRPDGRLRPFDEEQHPVVFVTRAEAMAYCAWLSEQDPRFLYRLPTREEWVHAASAASIHSQWPWPAGSFSATDFANIADQSLLTYFPDRTEGVLPDQNDGQAFTAEVGTYLPNGLGLHDMAGNVAEWVSDNLPQSRKYANPEGWALGGSFLASLEKSAFDKPETLNAAMRYGRVGFRLVRVPK